MEIEHAKATDTVVGLTKYTVTSLDTILKRQLITMRLSYTAPLTPNVK